MEEELEAPHERGEPSGEAEGTVVGEPLGETEGTVAEGAAKDGCLWDAEGTAEGVWVPRRFWSSWRARVRRFWMEIVGLLTLKRRELMEVRSRRDSKLSS